MQVWRVLKVLLYDKINIVQKNVENIKNKQKWEKINFQIINI